MRVAWDETCGIPDTPVGRVGTRHTVHERALAVSGSGNSGAGARLERNRPIAIARGFRLQWKQARRTLVKSCPEGMARLGESGGATPGRCGGERTAEGVVTSMKVASSGADLEDDVVEFLDIALGAELGEAVHGTRSAPFA